ncbi:DUF4244 domain-containing protein [Streptomyces piniterrae]|uniref:DUF4244 domain-containing protein n=1 Tax=Streptomyces piniterrae TaxID=2571125 RepID=A0A4U0MQ14_9ACTN|nr:DUF4244 domain-containing protein [Streptomyces piniterrae]
MFRRWWTALRTAQPDRGMVTGEYAVGTLAACALAAVLFKVLTSAAVQARLTSLVQGALDVPF